MESADSWNPRKAEKLNHGKGVDGAVSLKIKNSNAGRISPSALCLLSLVLSVRGFIHFDYRWLFTSGEQCGLLQHLNFISYNLVKERLGEIERWEERGLIPFLNVSLKNSRDLLGLTNQLSKTSQLTSGRSDIILAQSWDLYIQRGHVYTEGRIILGSYLKRC